ncbi:hypothetical protein K470DRAFT_53090 [Piedraia hortae CBS 480.64]|uniref:K Homology domain-containing protein n=1 Tax=Piedraia hortae CBS 480.64 TaxID=1314780 RepID=A0A6A7C9E2_9PEZI|nr:hypothetical protein K470DRAFT_53090 [Piedraia hortae CBS 480.64]
MSEEQRKRSRFDKTEPVRRTRFDRRSRSPPSHDDRHRPQRERSLPAGAASPQRDSKTALDAASRAAEAAARINAMINAKKIPQHVDVPPIRSVGQASAAVGSELMSQAASSGSKSPSQPPMASNINNDVYTQDGDFIKDIEVNDLRNRYTLTKGATQKMIKEKTGADVTTRGNYYPDKSLATAANPPLYLHVTSTTKEGLDKAVEEIEELMKVDLPNLVDERRFRRHGAGPDGQERGTPFERDHLGRRKWPEEKIPINLEPISGFNLRAQVVGAGGSYVKHIQNSTGCRVQIKGRGSGFIENETGRESDEAMFLHVAGPDASQVQAAKEQCLSLLESVKQSYEAHKERRHNGGDRPVLGGERTPGPVDSYGSPYTGGGYTANIQSPMASNAPNQAYQPNYQQGQQQQTMTPQQYQAWLQYYQEHPEADPYTAYGGFAAVWASYMAQYYAAAQASPVGAGGSDQSAVPPPPPPPPGSEGSYATGGYSHVPPPPGL